MIQHTVSERNQYEDKNLLLFISLPENTIKLVYVSTVSKKAFRFPH